MIIRVESPNLNPLLSRLVCQLRNRNAFAKLWANAAAMEGRANARAKGGRRYWIALARSVRVRSVTEREAEVSSDQVGANQKQFGGVIRPKRAKMLTIPIAPEAHGKTAYELQRPDRPLFVLPGTKLLGYTLNSEFRPLFILARQVVQRPDPWFPGALRLYQLGIREARALFNKEEAQWNTSQ